MNIGNHISPYRSALLLSILVHFLLFGALLFNMPASKPKAMTLSAKNVSTQRQPMTAVSMNSKEIMAHVAKIKQKKASQAKAQRDLEAKQRKLKKQLKAEQRKLKNIEAKKKRALREQKKKMRAEAAKLEQLKKDRKNIEQKLKNAAEKQKTIEAKTKAEEAALEKARAAKAELEKKKALKAKQAAELAAKTKAFEQSELQRYQLLIISAIQANWLIPPEKSGLGLSSKLLISCDNNGRVTHVKLTRSSGDAIVDQTAIAAVYKSSPLELPTNPKLLRQFKQIHLTMKPDQVLSDG